MWLCLSPVLPNLVTIFEKINKKSQIFFDHQKALIGGSAENVVNLEEVLGGLGQERVSQLVEERVAIGKCGNITCTMPVRVEKPASEGSFQILNNGDIVSCREIEQFCSLSCFRNFKKILNNRPITDVWDLEVKMLESQKKQLTSLTPQNFMIIKGVEEKQVSKNKVKKKFPIPGTLEANDVIFNDPLPASEEEFQGKKAKASKKVTFDIDDETMDLRINSDEDEERENENSEDETEDLLASFYELSLLPNNIEESGLNLFAIVWHFLLITTTEHTKRAIFTDEDVTDWVNSDQPFSLNEHEILNERHCLIERKLFETLDICNFSGSNLFLKNAKTELTILIPTLDVSREIPELTSNQWTLLTATYLGALAEAGKFLNFDYENDDICSCFPIDEFSQIDSDTMKSLKAVLKPD